MIDFQYARLRYLLAPPTEPGQGFSRHFIAQGLQYVQRSELRGLCFGKILVHIF